LFWWQLVFVRGRSLLGKPRVWRKIGFVELGWQALVKAERGV
jgi:hypothetical protein